MTSLIQLPGATPTSQFDIALDEAFKRASANGSSAEPYFVRELISEKTIRALNTASANSYDENFNTVRFRGGFLHARPWAEFKAKDCNGNEQNCRRELADAILVFHLTEQDGTGAHKVVRRAACLLMFKKSDAATPNTPSYTPLGVSLPNGTDQEQFYLFNQWPKFKLSVSRNKKIEGKGAYALNHINFNIGKYSLLWDEKNNSHPWDHYWRYCDPRPSEPVNDSLGSLLAKLVSSDPGVGQEFHPICSSDWDHLVKDVLHYAETYSWKGSRNINPAGLSFLAQFETNIESIGTCAQHVRSLFEFSSFHLPLWHQALIGQHPSPPSSFPEDGIPVIFATASSFRSPERQDGLSLEARERAVLRAISHLL